MPPRLATQHTFDAPFVVIAGDGATIRSMLFGPPPSRPAMLANRLRALHTTLGRVHAIADAFPGADPGRKSARLIEANIAALDAELRSAAA